MAAPMASTNDLTAFVQTTTGDLNWNITGDTELLAGVASARYEVSQIQAMHTDTNDVVADRLMVFLTNDTRFIIKGWVDIKAQAVSTAVGGKPPEPVTFNFSPPIKLPGTTDKLTVKSAVTQNWEWVITQGRRFS